MTASAWGRTDVLGLVVVADSGSPGANPWPGWFQEKVERGILGCNPPRLSDGFGAGMAGFILAALDDCLMVSIDHQNAYKGSA